MKGQKMETMWQIHIQQFFLNCGILKNKSHMIISTDMESTFDEIKSQFL